MKKVLVAMAFWDDGKESRTRLRNCKFAYQMMQNNIAKLGKEQYTIDVKLFDFSPTPVFEQSIHIPYPLAEYRRSEKLNKIIFNHTDGYDIICMIDSDTFFLDESLNAFNEILNNVEPDANRHYLFNLHDIDHINIAHVDFASFTVSPQVVTTERYQNNACGTFGGWYVSPVKFLKQAGGYNEEIKTWGGEDGDLYMRLDAIKPFSYINASKVKIYHLSHDTDWGNPNYYKSR